MRLGEDCTISGIPTSLGMFSFGFKLTASGINGESKGSATIQVLPPNLEYKFSPKYSTDGKLVVNLLTTSDVFSDSPVVNGSSPWPHSSVAPVTWKFQVTSGSLPPGLKVDSATGIVSGQPTLEGSYKAAIGSTVTSRFGDLVIPSRQYSIDVTPLRLIYSYNGTVDYVLSNLYVASPYSNAPGVSPPMTNGKPNVLSNFSVAAKSTIYGPTGTAPITTTGLPTGLNIDRDTGIISGIPLARATTYSFAQRYDNSVEFVVSATVNQGNGLPPTQVTTKFVQNLELPFHYYYGQSVYSFSFSGTRAPRARMNCYTYP